MCDVNARLAAAMAEDLAHRPPAPPSFWHRLFSLLSQSSWRIEA
jgi:hypothetical protein